GADRASPEVATEVARHGGMHPRDVRQAEANARGDRLAGALDRTASLSAAATEAKGRRQLPGDEVELRTCARHASLVVAALGVVQLAVQIRQPLAVVRPRPAVEDGVSGDAWGYPEPLRNEFRGGGAAGVGRRTGGRGDQTRAVASALVRRAVASRLRAPASRVRSRRACASWVHARKGRAPMRSCTVVASS